MSAFSHADFSAHPQADTSMIRHATQASTASGFPINSRSTPKLILRFTNASATGRHSTSRAPAT
jgi:hypothetical protein